MEVSPVQERTFVIAEVGVNHDGSLRDALELVEAAAWSGADAVKFQTFRPESLVSARAEQAAYQRSRVPASSQLEMLQHLVLSPEDHESIAGRCEEVGLEFLSTAFDEVSLEWLLDLGMRRIKVPSGELTNGPLLLAYGRADRDLIVSTGMADLGEIAQALAVLSIGRRGGVPRGRRGEYLTEDLLRLHSDRRCGTTLLHCTSSYPASPADVHLRAMDTMRLAFELPVGYSDHTLGTVVSAAAVARGAVVIEKHVTLDRRRVGPDHAASLEPPELGRLIRDIRDVEAALGSSVKGPTAAERDTALTARRSLHARTVINEGEMLTLENLVALRPSDGQSPMEIWDLLGRPARRSYGVGDPIEEGG